jgi:hypothetical protein
VQYAIAEANLLNRELKWAEVEAKVEAKAEAKRA